MRAFRVVLILLILILLLPVWPLLSRNSSTADAVFGRYTVRYFLILLAYGGLLIGLAAAAIMARPAWAGAIQTVLRPVHRFWIVAVVLGLLLFESWYRVRDVLHRTIYFGTEDSLTYRLMLVFSGLLIAYILGVVVLAGREPDNLKQVAGNLVVLGFGLGLAFAIFSFAYAWVLNGEAYSQAHTVWGATRNDPLLGTMTRSNLDDYQMYLPDEQRTVSVSTNSEGFRGPDVDEDRPVAVIGDSFVFGLFSGEDSLWSNTLSELLDMPVANYGIWGIDLNRYIMIADRYIQPGEHDLVIYAIYANDLAVKAPLGTPLDLHRLRASRRYTRSPISYTYAHFFVQQSPFQLLFSPPPASAGPSEPTAHGYLAPCYAEALVSDYSDGVRDLMEQHLDVMLELAEQDDYEVAFVLVPSLVSVYEDEVLPTCDPEFRNYVANEAQGFADLCAYVEARGHACYDTTESFREAADRPEPLFLSIDTHWNELGNEVFAHLLAEYLKSEGFAP